MKIESNTSCYRSSPSIQNSECFEKKCMESGKQRLEQVGGTRKDGPMDISRSKVLDTFADEVTSEEYIGDSEPGFGFTHGYANKTDTVIRSQDENESFSSCKTEFVESELYNEKTITEVSSKLITCYKAGSCYVIKDICVDDGKSEEKYLKENYNSKEKLSTGLMQLDSDEEDGLSKKLAGKTSPLVDCGIGSNSTLEKDKVLKFADSGMGSPKDGDVEELVCDAVGRSNDSTVPSNQVEGQAATVRMDFNNGKDSACKKEHSQITKSSKEEQSLQFSSKIGSKSITFTFDPSIPAPSFNNNGDAEEERAAAATARQPEHQRFHSLAELCFEERSPSGEPTSSLGSSCHVPGKLDGTQGRNSSSEPADVSEKLQTGLPSTSASITFSGPVQYSGSISLRSDSSATSARSFAFPVLQSEWNSSPVRMAKADARQFRKHRGWRMSLLCCRF
ncbi:unnamed protein product [Victoria cruziana]